MTPLTLATAVGCPIDVAARWVDPLQETAIAYDLATNLRAAMFLAQVGHETGGFRWLREIWGPTAAQLGYEGRADLGNTQPGDGKRYMGRGLIQVTGRDNYIRLTERLRRRYPESPDFVADPDALCLPRWAALSAGDYWQSRSINVHADAGDIVRVTRLINGGTNGLPDRRARYELALEVFR